MTYGAFTLGNSRPLNTICWKMGVITFMSCLYGCQHPGIKMSCPTDKKLNWLLFTSWCQQGTMRSCPFLCIKPLVKGHDFFFLQVVCNPTYLLSQPTTAESRTPIQVISLWWSRAVLIKDAPSSVAKDSLAGYTSKRASILLTLTRSYAGVSYWSMNVKVKWRTEWERRKRPWSSRSYSL